MEPPGKFRLKCFRKNGNIGILWLRPSRPGGYILRIVRKDNTILNDSNRYSVPLRTPNQQCRGMLIQNKSHLRDRTTALDQLQDSLDERLDCQATEFLQRIREESPGMPETSSDYYSPFWTGLVQNRCWMPFRSAWIAACTAPIPSGITWNTGRRKRQKSFHLPIRRRFPFMTPSTISPPRNGLWRTMQR